MAHASADNTFRNRTPWPSTALSAPVLAVVIDTEEEFNWAAPFDPTARSVTNIDHQPLAQAIFDRHGVVPTYVVDYPVATSPSSIAILRSFAEQGRCEIGTHLHPWVNPPRTEVISDTNSFPGNLPAELERSKLAALTEAIAENFGTRPTIYKAGRYGIGPATAGILDELKYTIDLSVIPHFNFSQKQGPDFRGFPTRPFKVGASLTALPLGVGFAGRLSRLGPGIYPLLTGPLGLRLHLPGITSYLGLLERICLSPETYSLDEMRRLTTSAIKQGQRFFLMAYHSSSLLPGATNYVRNEADRTAFLNKINDFIGFFLQDCGGYTASISDIAQSLRDNEANPE